VVTLVNNEVMSINSTIMLAMTAIRLVSDEAILVSDASRFVMNAGTAMTDAVMCFVNTLAFTTTKRMFIPNAQTIAAKSIAVTATMIMVGTAAARDVLT